MSRSIRRLIDRGLLATVPYVDRLTDDDAAEAARRYGTPNPASVYTDDWRSISDKDVATEVAS